MSVEELNLENERMYPTIHSTVSNLQLMRTVLLKSKKSVVNGCDDPRIKRMDKKTFIQPEGEPVVVYEREIDDCNQGILNK